MQSRKLNPIVKKIFGGKKKYKHKPLLDPLERDSTDSPILDADLRP